LPYFKGKRLDEIKPSHISLWQNKMLSFGLKPKRVKDIRIVLSVILEDAVCDEIINSNPVRKVTKLPMQPPPQINPFCLDEIKAILHHATGQFKNFFAVAFFTGMRTGEIIGLKWEDIDFNQNEISIRRTINKGMETTPKTIGSVRTIEILPTLLKFLKNQHSLTGDKNSYVFLNGNDKNYFDSNKIRDYSWKTTLINAGVEYRTIYNTRHTFASLMISKGEDVLWVSHMLGHSSTEMTLRKYTKYIKNEKKKRATFLTSEI
jgi:integrase